MIPGYREFQSRSVRIFISSTFQDMDAERNLLVEDVFPRLRARFAPQGIAITEVDLRWGIPESLAADHRTLQICIQEIENCQPFFMGILGEREGYQPSVDEVAQLDEHLRELIDLDGSHGVSITEMEIHAGIHVSTPATASFHVRGEDAEGNERLGTFERRVASMGYPCRRYETLAAFAEQVVDAVSAMVTARFGDDVLAGVDETYRAHLAHLVAERAGVVPSAELQRLVSVAQAGTDIHISAGRGMGKTAALAYLATALGDELDQDVLFHFAVGGGQPSAQELWYRLLGFLGAHPADDEVDVGAVGLWLREHPLPRPAYVLVDDAARFAGHQDVRNRLLALSEMDERLVVICTADDEPATWRGASVRLGPLDEEQVGQIARGYFRGFGKVLEDAYVERLCANDALRHPLLLRCLLNEERTALSFEGFDEGFARLSSLGSFDEAVDAIARRVAGQLGELGLDGLATWRVMEALASVKGGLYEEEVLAVTGAVPLEWSIIRASLQGVLRAYDGLWSVSEGVAREAMTAAVQANDPQVEDLVRERLTACFQAQDVTARTSDELAYLLDGAGDADRLIALLGSYERVAPLAAARRETLVGYLTKVQGRSRELAAPLAAGLTDERVGLEALDDLLLSLNESGCYQAVVALAPCLRASLGDRAGYLVILDKHEARAQYKMGTAHYGEALATYDQGLARLEGLEGRSARLLAAELTFQRAIVQKSSGHPDHARSSYEAAIEAYRALGVEDVNASWALGNLASLLYLYGEDAQSGELFDEAVRMRAKAFGERSPEVAWTYCYLFRLAFSTGDVARAGAIAADAMRFYAESFGEMSPQYAWAEVNRGNWLAATGQLYEARELLLDSIDKNDRFMGSKRADAGDTAGRKKPGIATYSLTSVGNIAVVDWLLGKRDEARAMLAEVEEHTRRVHGDAHPYACNARLNVALAGERDDALAVLPEILDALTRELGEQAPDVQFVRQALDAARGMPCGEVAGALGDVYLARNNGAQLVIVPSWMRA